MITSPRWSGSPETLHRFGDDPLQDPDLAAQELERCVRDLGLRSARDWHARGRKSALRTHRHFESRQCFASAGLERGGLTFNAAIFVHPWDMLGKERMPNYWITVARRDAG